MNRTIALLVSIACAGCDALFGLVSITSPTALCEGCTDSGTSTDADAGIDSRGSGDAKLDAGSASYQDAPAGFTCNRNSNITAGQSCDCIYDGAGCVSGLACLDDINFITPVCESPGTAASGASCSVSPMTAAQVCAVGEWCAWNSNTHSTTLGTCRALCDPLHEAGTPSCPGSQTCVGMPACFGQVQYPNCAADPTSHSGYCQ